ncbi:MAG: hypothetical protein ACRCWJ_17765 [Casimicrobium sp.]
MHQGAFFVIAILMTPFAMIIRGWALSVLWSWFIVQQFGLRELRIPEAIGLAIVVGWLAMPYNFDYEKLSDEKKLTHGFFTGFVYPFMILGIAWIVKQFL